jgi:hypothetical protein
MGDVKKMISVLIPVGLQDEETSPPSTAGGHFPEMGQVEDFFETALKTPGQSASLFASRQEGKHMVSLRALALKERFPTSEARFSTR